MTTDQCFAQAIDAISDQLGKDSAEVVLTSDQAHAIRRTYLRLTNPDRPVWTPQQQEQHRADLAAAIK